MAEVTLQLNTTPEALIDWLKDQTARIYLDFFPMSRGGCTLQPIRGPENVGNSLQLYLDAFYWDGEIPRSGQVHPHPAAIVFQLDTTKPMTLTIKCAFSPVQVGYHDLLVAILMRWPEVQTQLHQIQPPASQDLSDEPDLTAFNWRDWLLRPD
jgi:hypothetical protein